METYDFRARLHGQFIHAIDFYARTYQTKMHRIHAEIEKLKRKSRRARKRRRRTSNHRERLKWFIPLKQKYEIHENVNRIHELSKLSMHWGGKSNAKCDEQKCERKKIQQFNKLLSKLSSNHTLTQTHIYNALALVQKQFTTQHQRPQNNRFLFSCSILCMNVNKQQRSRGTSALSSSIRLANCIRLLEG